MIAKSKSITLSLPTEMIFAADGSVTGGITSRTVVPSAPLNGGAFSFSAWVKCANPESSYNRIFELEASCWGCSRVVLSFQGEYKTMQYKRWDTSGVQNVFIVTTELFPTNTWVLVQFIHRNNNIASIYWDGEEKVSGSVPLPLVANRTWNIGNKTRNVNTLFQGSMKEVVFFNGEADFKHLPSYAHDPTKLYWVPDQIASTTCTTLGCSSSTTTNNTFPPCPPTSMMKSDVCWVFMCPAGQYHLSPTQCKNMTNTTCPSGIGFHSACAQRPSG
jgi:hypothetical protein